MSQTGSSEDLKLLTLGGKTYDFGTKNRSFINLAKELEYLGIKNCYFMLELYDSALTNIDPYAVDSRGHSILTKDQIERVMLECKRNPWYYLREIARIPNIDTHVPYKANRGNIAQAWCILKGYDSWLCLPRQEGEKTQSALAIMAWMYLFGTRNTEFNFVHKNSVNAKANLRHLQYQLELLPEYMQFDENGSKIKHDKNTTTLFHPVTKNSIMIKSGGTTYVDALSLACDLTAPVLHFDDAEYISYIGTIVKNSLSTFEKSVDTAKRNHRMYGRMFTSIPGDLDTEAGVEAQQILFNTQKWTEKCYDWTDEEIQRYIDSKGEDCNRILYIKYSYHQIGLTNGWLKKISAKIDNPIIVRREILLQRFPSSNLLQSPKNRHRL